MEQNTIIFGIAFAIFGFICSQIYRHSQKMNHDKEVGKAVNALRLKGFRVNMDRLSGFDAQTQREMELARSVGYTVLDTDGSPIQVGQKKHLPKSNQE